MNEALKKLIIEQVITEKMQSEIEERLSSLQEEIDEITVGSMVFRGNTVSYLYDKYTAIKKYMSISNEIFSKCAHYTDGTKTLKEVVDSELRSL